MKLIENPFKLIGSYIGLIIGLIGSYFSFAIPLYYSEIGRFNLFLLLIPIIPMIIGFFLGAFLHSIIRGFLE